MHCIGETGPQRQPHRLSEERPGVEGFRGWIRTDKTGRMRFVPFQRYILLWHLASLPGVDFSFYRLGVRIDCATILTLALKNGLG